MLHSIGAFNTSSFKFGPNQSCPEGSLVPHNWGCNTETRWWFHSWLCSCEVQAHVHIPYLRLSCSVTRWYLYQIYLFALVDDTTLPETFLPINMSNCDSTFEWWAWSRVTSILQMVYYQPVWTQWWNYMFSSLSPVFCVRNKC
jgi:hypothetical protein